MKTKVWRIFFAIGLIALGATSVLAQDVALRIVNASGADYMDIDPRDEDSWWLFLEVGNTTVATVTLNAVTLEFSFDNRYLSVDEATTDNTKLSDFTFSYGSKVKGDLTTVKISLVSTTGYALAASSTVNCSWLKLNPHRMNVDVRYDLMGKTKIYDATPPGTTYKREDTAQVYCDTTKGDNSCAGPVANPVTGYDVLMASRQVVELEDYIGDSVLLKDIMDTNADGEIDAEDVYHTAEKAADASYTMPADVSGAHPAPSKAPIIPNSLAKTRIFLRDFQRVNPSEYRLILAATGLPQEPVGVDVEFIFASDLGVKINFLEMVKASNKAFAIQNGKAHLVFSEPEAYKNREGRVAEIQLRVAEPNQLPEFMIAWVMINEGKIPVSWQSKRVLVPETRVLQNYPNPLNPETWIPFQLEDSNRQVSIWIFDITGRLVRTLELGEHQPGFYIEKSRAAYWDGQNNFGERVASGVYFYQLNSTGALKKMLVVK